MTLNWAFFLEVEQAKEVTDALRPSLTGSGFMTSNILLGNIGETQFFLLSDIFSKDTEAMLMCFVVLFLFFSFFLASFILKA